MRRILILITLIVLSIFTYLYFKEKNDQRNELLQASELIEKQIKNVGKLIVTEGSFGQVFSYKDSKGIAFNLVTANKKALVVVNAKVIIAYDLRELKTEVDEENKTITITHIPKPEITINPDIEYYDVTQDYLNQFEASDYNIIKKKVNTLIRKKIEASDMRKNADNRLIAELSNIYVAVNTLGWTLKYNTTEITNAQTLNEILD